MTEQEEFEFRHRYEQEQAAAASTAPNPEPNLWQQARPYVAPVVETAGMLAGGLLGGAGGTVAAPGPGTVAGGVAGAGLGYGMGRQLMQIGDTQFGGQPQQPVGEQALGAAKDVATGAVLESGGRALLPIAGRMFMAIPGVKTATGWLADVTSGNLVQIKAGKIVREVAADKLPAVRSALANAPENVTAGQAVAGAGVNAPTFQALEKSAATKMPEAFTDVYGAQEAARRAALEGVTPDRAAAEEVRDRMADWLYSGARGTDATRRAGIAEEVRRVGTLSSTAGAQPIPSPVTPALEALRANPTIMAAVREVRTLNPGVGDPLASVEGMDLMKKVIDAQFRSPQAATALQNYTQSQLASTKTQLLRALEEVSPLYGQARRTFARLSEPVNQSAVLGEMSSVLRSPTGVGERVTPFLNAADRGARSLLKRTTGQPRYTEIDQVLNPQQMGVVNNIAGELGRDARMAQQASAGTARLNEILGESTQAVQSPGLLNRIVYLANEVSRKLQGKVNKKTINLISESMLSNKPMLEILNSIPAAERGAVMQALQSSGAGRLVGATANAINSDFGQPQNALAQ